MPVLIEEGDRVRYGFRTGKVLRLECRDHIDGAVVAPDVIHQEDGLYPHWVPLFALTVLPPRSA